MPLRRSEQWFQNQGDVEAEIARLQAALDEIERILRPSAESINRTYVGYIGDLPDHYSQLLQAYEVAKHRDASSRE